MKQFAHRVEQHHGDSLGILADKERAQRGDNHQGELVKEIFFCHGAARVLEGRQGDRQVRGNIPHQPGGSGEEHGFQEEVEEDTDEKEGAGSDHR